jgi:hypothetical protein
MIVLSIESVTTELRAVILDIMYSTFDQKLRDITVI